MIWIEYWIPSYLYYIDYIIEEIMLGKYNWRFEFLSDTRITNYKESYLHGTTSLQITLCSPMGYPMAKSLLCVQKMEKSPARARLTGRLTSSVRAPTPKNTIALATRMDSRKAQLTELWHNVTVSQASAESEDKTLQNLHNYGKQEYLYEIIFIFYFWEKNILCWIFQMIGNLVWQVTVSMTGSQIQTKDILR